MKQFLLFFTFLMATFMINVSAHKSIWPSCNGLTNKDRSTCIQFQYLKGSNRLTEFKKISTLIFNSVELKNQKKYYTTSCTIYDIKKILGTPDDSKDDTTITYYLNPDEPNCKAEISINPINQTVSCVVYNCL